MLPNSMEQSSSWEDDGRSATQEISRVSKMTNRLIEDGNTAISRNVVRIKYSLAQTVDKP
jgi:hypothetical protein